MKRFKRLDLLARSALVFGLLLQSALSFADDTEIFLSRGKADVKPNVFFILDNSVSMKWCLDKDDWTPYPWALCPNGTTTTRRQVFQEVMDQLLVEMKDVNLGMMDMPHVGQVRIPIDDIEKVREKARKAVKDMTFPYATPITYSLYQAARYINGYPRYRADRHNGDVGHWSYPAFVDEKPESPIKDACQPTHLVLVTDGDAMGGDYYDAIGYLINKPLNIPIAQYCNLEDKANNEYNKLCASELVQWMHTEDQTPKFEGTQTVTTHTIGFALQDHPKSTPDKIKKAALIKKFLKELATVGGGNAYTASDADKLTDAFNDILQQAAQVDNATFVNPSAAPTVYYALFQPGGSDRWPGNLKRYRFGAKDVTKNGKPSKEAVIYDVNDNEAINANGAFKADAQSFWSEGADGANITLGGAVWKLPEPAKRHLFVETEGKLGELAISNTAISNDLLGAADNDERVVLLNYIRGLSDDGSIERGKSLGDFLHSAPVPFSYGSAETDQVIIVGSNEGFVHLFNRKTGVEEFAFMPGNLLKNIKPIKANEPSTRDKPHPYGVDNTVTVWLDDSNQNGQFDAGEHFYAYITLRRGGQGIYALDITERGQPKLLWQIDEKNKKAKGFARMGQSWSQPVKSKIKIGNASQPQDVLIFAGGYDPTEDNFNGDNDAYRGDTALGNAIYIVDAKTGDYIWSASQSGGVLNLPDMKYSIPSSVKAVDINNDGLADQLFVGDTGGQIWRLFIHNGEASDNLVTASGANVNAPFAQLGEDNPENARRFYQEPDVALDRSNNRLLVNIGSGYRAHPLNANVDDRFYSLHADLTSSPDLPLTEANLHEATRSFDNFDKEQTVKAINTAQGWYLPLKLARAKKYCPRRAVPVAMCFSQPMCRRATVSAAK